MWAVVKLDNEISDYSNEPFFSTHKDVLLFCSTGELDYEFVIRYNLDGFWQCLLSRYKCLHLTEERRTSLKSFLTLFKKRRAGVKKPKHLDDFREEYLRACAELKKQKLKPRKTEDAYLVSPIFEMPLSNAIEELRTVHGFLVARAKATVANAHENGDHWTVEMQSLTVNLQGANRPRLVGKEVEGLAELLSVTASLERLIVALAWFGSCVEFTGLTVLECHSSPGSPKNVNDIVLSDDRGQTKVRCDVRDVASDSAGEAGKERKYLRSLGCEVRIPDDGARRFICTSTEFATVLRSEKRDWQRVPHRYVLQHANEAAQIVVLEIVTHDESRSETRSANRLGEGGTAISSSESMPH